MTPDRLQQIEELFHSAREASADECVALLGRADPELRREVESLLARRNDRLILDRSAQWPGDRPTTVLHPGDRLGPYQVECKLGQGGMGEVFRAIDTRLGRAVAIKITDEQFNERFEREARAISSLNHPNICTLHDIGPNYLVMELVEGETIAARLNSGPLPVETALLYASQIAAALAEAHGKGVIHRDLKPGNIMIAKSGVKVLDFGLAKSEADETLTGSEMVMGTPAYMAPEQREAKLADARSDIYSFGCVLYEMVTGVRAAVQRKRVSPRRLEQIVDRCLQPDPARRWQSAAELERALTRPTMPWNAIAAALAAAVLAVSAGTYFLLHRAPKLTDKDTIVLADFENKTGDPVFNDTLRQGLSMELQQSPFLSLIPDQQAQATLALMRQPKDVRVTPEIARQICERIGSAAVLEGSIASLGSQYVLGLIAKNCTSGSVLDQEQSVAARREDVLNALSQIARRFRIRVGESLASVEKHSTPLVEATTPSLEALKAFSTGIKTAMSSGNAAGIPFNLRAIELDPQFAEAYALLGLAYNSNGESELGAESTRKAWQLRDRVSDNEKFFIDFSYDRQVTGNLEKAYGTLEAWIKTYPRGGQPNARSLLGGLATHGTGRFEIALEASKNALAEDPDSGLAYTAQAYSYFLTSRFPEAESTLQRASERKLKTPDLLVIRYNIAALKGDQEQMDQAVALARGMRRAEYWMSHQQALALARSGRLQAAGRSSSRAVDLALQEGAREEAANYQAARGYWEAAYGNAAEGKRNAIASLALSKGRDVEYVAALAFAFSGDSARSQSLADDLEKRFPEDTFSKFGYVPVLRALAALAHGKPAESGEQLQMALRYELAANGLNFNRLSLGGLHSSYVRGQALAAQHRYAEAAAEFQKILDHRGLAGLDPIGALAHSQLGRVFVLSGEKDKASVAYRNFLTLWKDADANIPILRQVKAEYARLI
ncbi:MAG TPA: protein kinase [Bryobacteraceae bacterium]|nr:protein kinase [Bryobacteraceae bacterium]